MAETYHTLLENLPDSRPEQIITELNGITHDDDEEILEEIIAENGGSSASCGVTSIVDPIIVSILVFIASNDQVIGMIKDNLGSYKNPWVVSAILAILAALLYYIAKYVIQC